MYQSTTSSIKPSNLNLKKLTHLLRHQKEQNTIHWQIPRANTNPPPQKLIIPPSNLIHYLPKHIIILLIPYLHLISYRLKRIRKECRNRSRNCTWYHYMWSRFRPSCIIIHLRIFLLKTMHQTLIHCKLHRHWYRLEYKIWLNTFKKSLNSLSFVYSLECLR